MYISNHHFTITIEGDCIKLQVRIKLQICPFLSVVFRYATGLIALVEASEKKAIGDLAVSLSMLPFHHISVMGMEYPSCLLVYTVASHVAIRG